MKRMAILTFFLALIFLLVPSVKPACALNIDLIAGTTGTLFNNQSFNETRAVDVEVVSGVSLQVQSMSLREFNIGSGTGVVGARIYDSDSGGLIASANQTVGAGFDQSVTIPLSATLDSGETYRVGFFIVTDPLGQGSGDGLDADPAGLSINPYIEPTGSLRIIQAYQIASDNFPTNLNGLLPLITVEANPVPVPGALILLGSGLLGLTCLRRFSKS
jgi:hypothetical protein